MSWNDWAAGVLNGIGAPVDAANVDTLWAWSHAETAPYDLMRWNNPLNTTEPWPGARDSGAQPGPHDVKIYATENDGVLATVATLDNGSYPVILANLRGSVPRAGWTNACPNLHTWGTGCNWLQSTYGPAPVILGADDMFTDADRVLLTYCRDHIIVIHQVLAGTDSAVLAIAPGGHALQDDVPKIVASLAGVASKIDALPAAIAAAIPAGQTQDLTGLIAAIQANTAQLAAQTTELNAISGKLTNLTLKAA